MAQLLKERPKLRMNVCGRATAADLDAYLATALAQKTAPQPAPTGAAQPASPAAPTAAQQELEKARTELTELATKRGRDVQQYLVDEHGIKPGSVGECRSSFDATDQGPPRAELSL